MIKYVLQEIRLKENFNMKNTEIVFYSFKQYILIDIHMDMYRCTSEKMEIHMKYFVFFLCSWRLKLKYSQNPKLFWQFQVVFHMFVTYVMYLDFGIDDKDNYDDGESCNEDYYN